MTNPSESNRPDFDPFDNPLGLRRQWARERRERIVQEVLANRKGQYKVPTWVLGACLLVMVAAIVLTLALY